MKRLEMVRERCCCDTTRVHSPTSFADLESTDPICLRRLIEFSSLFIVIVFDAQLDAVAGSKLRSSVASAWTGVYTPSGNGISTVRALRSGDDGNNGERGGFRWLDQGKSAVAVFVRMRLDKADSSLIYSAEFPQWLDYVGYLNAKGSTKETSAMSILSSHLGDETLYKMIDEAQFITGTKDLAAHLERKLMQYWVVTAKAPGDAFHFMELNKAERNLLQNTKFNAWV
ncbi:unnamed protein product [Phytophthora fragariaefolia]|uniref:Unnamed protein product n=1 Tax=Phytophthora fragariaefolia TaxID=1490495 RepID=A0A9W7CYN5_9STRA|nr:unnamed protein product [Phytophthora fragariaefolia]